jgi:4-hydroxy-2-oxoheptanedioate aldolase
MALVNPLKEKLRRGEVAIGVGLRQARTVDIAKAMKTAGYDWLFIDTEHNSMDLDTAAQISVAAQDAGVTPIVRVAGYEHWLTSRILDNGALGVVVPHVDTAELTAKLVSYVRYPPLGRRSVTGALPQIDFQSLPLKETTSQINEATMLVVMTESPQSVENIDRIAATEGLDGVLVGTNDLCMELGVPGQLDHPKVIAAYERVLAACKANGLFPGLGGVYEPKLLERYVKMGFRMILAGSDMSFMMAAARERAKAIREFGL